jgi:hypothetical protein
MDYKKTFGFGGLAFNNYAFKILLAINDWATKRNNFNHIEKNR